MPFLDINQAKIHYQEAGQGPETIVFSHGLLMNCTMYRAQVEVLSKRYRCISYDHRGQGRSEVTKGGYDMDSLADDAAALIRALDCGACHFVGLSMGGFVGMRLAIHRPELLKSLTLMDTSAGPEPEHKKGSYRRMAFVGRWLGFRLVVKPVMKLLFGQTFLNDPDRESLREEWKQRLISLDRIGATRAARGVIERKGVEENLSGITTPTLIIVGEEDAATPVPMSRSIHEAISESKLAIIPRAGHTSNIEEPDAVNRALEPFLASVKWVSV